MSEDEQQYVEVPVDTSPVKIRPPGWLITVALTGVTGACIGALFYAVAFDGPGTEGALTTLGQLATIGLTGLLALAGVSGRDT